MRIQFGLELQHRTFPVEGPTTTKTDYCFGQLGLITLLEKEMGILLPARHTYLRFEQYRQFLLVHLQQFPTAFYSQSFKADSMATAKALLERRDELLLAGWSFGATEHTPSRLKVFAQIEDIAAGEELEPLDFSFADRFCEVMNALDYQPDLPIDCIQLQEPLNLLPIYLQKLLEKLRAIGVQILEPQNKIHSVQNNLTAFQARLIKQDLLDFKPNPEDTSVLILKARSESTAAEYIAKALKQTPSFRPLCLIKDKNTALDTALVQEGAPSLGIGVATMARPTLQVLRLITTFLWNPIDPFKILEFVSLPSIPLHNTLKRAIAKTMAERPGLNSKVWFAVIENALDKIEQNAENKSSEEKTGKEIRDEAEENFNRLFKRTRYDRNKKVPREVLLDLFSFLVSWCQKDIERRSNNVDRIERELKKETDQNKIEELNVDVERKQKALLVHTRLFAQAKSIEEVLLALPEHEKFFTALQVDRLINMLSEPVAISLRTEEKGHLDYICHQTTIVEPIDNLLWWNFIDTERATNFERWYKQEEAYLKQHNCLIEKASLENERQLWKRIQPVMKVQEQLLLVVPDTIQGADQVAHPLMSDLFAAFGEDFVNEHLTVDLNATNAIAKLEKQLNLPSFSKLEKTKLEGPDAYLQLPDTDKLTARIEDKIKHYSYSSLNDLLYYPYKWLFKYVLDLKKTEILTVKEANTLNGSLAHKALENLFNAIKETKHDWTKKEVVDFIKKQQQAILEQEGAVLMMYGRESDRIRLLDILKHAAWTLVAMIQENNWEIVGVEHEVSGHIGPHKIKGIVDLVLKRNNQITIIDIKWRGKNYLERNFENQTDLQLVIYAKLIGEQLKRDNLITEDVSWADTAYFVLSDALMIARNNNAFEKAYAVGSDEDDAVFIQQDIWDKMTKTLEWRLRQLSSGQIEMRTKQNAPDIDAHISEYENYIELLEMKKEDASFDDYTVLIHPLE